MFRIAIICILLSFLKSGKCDLNETDLQLLKESFSEAIQYSKNEVKEEDTAIVMGVARAGKSTLINYLIGVPMIAWRGHKYDKIRIQPFNESFEGPGIGHTMLSTTSKPSRWVSSRLSNLALWDTPGFNDNRGDVADITNAFYLFQLLNHVKSLKIIIVASFPDLLTDNIGGFTKLLEYICKLLGNEIENAFKSISIIFTKFVQPAEGFLNYSELTEHLNNLLEAKILNVSLSMSTNAKRFVEYLTHHLDHIGFFNQATRTGTNISDVDVGIFQAIEASTSIPKSSLHSVHPSISPKSETSLRKALDKLTSLNEVYRLSDILKEDIVNQTTVVDNLDNLNLDRKKEVIETIIKRLEVFRDSMYDCLSKTCNLTTMINLTQSYSKKLADEIKKTNFTETIQLINFLDYILDSVRLNEYIIIFSSIIWSTNYQVRDIISKLQLKIRNITTTVYAEEEEKQKEIYAREIKRLVQELKDLKEKKPKQEDNVNNSFSVLFNIVYNYMANDEFFKELGNIFDSPTNSSSQTSTTTMPDDDDDDDLCW